MYISGSLGIMSALPPKTNNFIFVGNILVEIAELYQYSPHGKLYRIKEKKGHRLTMEQFNLFVFYSKTKLAGEWQKTGENTHVFSDVFVQMGREGVMLRTFFIKEGDMNPGRPKVFFTHDQWLNLMKTMGNIQQLLNPTSQPSPCFTDKSTHYDTSSGSFIGCNVCLPFMG